MAAVTNMLPLVLLGLCVLAGPVAHAFVVEHPDGTDGAWQFSTVNGNAVDEPAPGGRLVGELTGFQIKGFESYDAGVGGRGDNAFAAMPDQFSTRDVNANQFQEQGAQFNTQESSSSSSTSGDEGYVYNARLQSRDAPEFETNDVNAEPDNAAPYDYNRFSAPASEFDRGPSSANSHVLGVPEEREVQEARPQYAFDARAGSEGADDASFTTLDVQGGSDDQAVPAKEVGKTSEPADESLPPYVYNARTGSAESGEKGGSADGASFTTTESVQQESSDDQVVSAKGHQGPVSYYTPASDRNGAFVFYDTRSDEQKQLGSKVDGDSLGAASFASSDDTTSASTSPILAPQLAPQGSHGCPNSYWAEHAEQWPSPLKITTFVSQAFGGSTVKTNLEIIYGTTTLFQALLDTRDDPYSKLLRHAVAALLNAHAKTAYTLRPDEVAKLFNAALASKVAAAAQARKFENENHAFGDNECK